MPHFLSLYNEAKNGLEKTQLPNIIHGSLLMIGELLTHCQAFMRTQYDSVCKIVFRYHNHSNSFIVRQCLELFPKIPPLNYKDFVNNHARTTVEHIISVINQTSDSALQSYAFIALGEIALAIESAMLPFTERMLATFRNGLKSPPKKVASASPKDMPTSHACLACIGMLAASLGESLCPGQNQMFELVDQMFSTELSKPLIDALVNFLSFFNSLPLFLYIF